MTEHAEIAARSGMMFPLDDWPILYKEDTTFLLNEITRLEAETDRKQAGWDACTAGLEELDRRLAAAEAEVATLREAVLAYKAERDADEWGDDEALLARQMHARQRMFAAATPTATTREGGEG